MVSARNEDSVLHSCGLMGSNHRSCARQLCRQGSGSPGGQQGAPPLPSTGKAASGERCPVLPVQERDTMERVQVKATEMTKGSELFSHEKRL